MVIVKILLLIVIVLFSGEGSVGSAFGVFPIFGIRLITASTELLL